MHNRNSVWKIFGVLYFTAVFGLVPNIAFAYIDPSVTTYAIQAIAGVAVAAGAFFATYGRRFKKKWLKSIGVDSNEGKAREAELEVYPEDLSDLLKKQRSARKQVEMAKDEQPGKRKQEGRLLTSLICGLGFAMTISLRPILSFYLSNEGEFWFKLGDVIWFVLAIFAGIALMIGLIHYFLPANGKVSIRLIFAVCACAIALCVYVQNHFMSSYLPVLTGEEINWKLYSGWGIGSLILWGGVFVVFICLLLLKPRWTKVMVYSLLALLLCVETVTACADVLTAKHENVQDSSYFSTKGLYETSDAGNVVVLISDTFEGTYMNEILERYPEYKEILSDCTYYDNVTGVSVFTYFSYAKLLTGQDFPIGLGDQAGVRWCFDNQTIVDRIYNNGWDIAYYSDFMPTANVSTKIINYADNELKPDAKASWDLAKKLFRSSLFQSVPQEFKSSFIVYTSEYEQLKASAVESDKEEPYVEDDLGYYTKVKNKELMKTTGTKPKYSIVQLKGVHDPVDIDTEFNTVDYDENTSMHERKIIAGRASLNLMRAYLDALKEAGTYDQTTVIMIADHGFNMRFYPIMLVKEANSHQDTFKVDSTPLSLQEDYENMMVGLTSGQNFSEVVAGMNIQNERVRTALDFRSVDGSYSAWAARRSLVIIEGDARKEESYHIDRDEVVLDEVPAGRYKINEWLIQNGAVANDGVLTYGMQGGGSLYGHTVVVDTFLDEKNSKNLTMTLNVRNRTDVEQRVRVRVNDTEINTETLPADAERELVFAVPAMPEADKLTIAIDAPDAKQRYKEEEVLSWNEYDSIAVLDVKLESN